MTEVQYKDNGEPIPDGKLVIVVANQLAQAWDPHEQPPLYRASAPKDTYTFWFKDIRSHSKYPTGLLIRFPLDEGDRARTMLFIPWHQILEIDTYLNSREVVAALEKFTIEQNLSSFFEGDEPCGG